MTTTTEPAATSAAIGNLRTERRHVARAWELLRIAAKEVAV